jgi:hypothetical protein
VTVQPGAEFVLVGGGDPPLDHGVEAEDLPVAVDQWSAARSRKDVRVVENDLESIQDSAGFGRHSEASQPHQKEAVGVSPDLGSIIRRRRDTPFLSDFQIWPPDGKHGLGTCFATFRRGEPCGANLRTGRYLDLENCEVLLKIPRHDMNDV